MMSDVIVGADERPPETATSHITSGGIGQPTYKELYQVVKREAEQARREAEDMQHQMDAMRKENPTIELADRLKQELRELNQEYCDTLNMMIDAIRERNDLRVQVAILETK